MYPIKLFLAIIFLLQVAFCFKNATFQKINTPTEHYGPLKNNISKVVHSFIAKVKMKFIFIRKLSNIYFLVPDTLLLGHSSQNLVVLYFEENDPIVLC